MDAKTLRFAEQMKIVRDYVATLAQFDAQIYAWEVTCARVGRVDRPPRPPQLTQSDALDIEARIRQIIP